MDKKNKNLLPPNHKRVISVTARLLERELNELESLIGNKNERLTRKISKALTEEQRELIHKLIGEVKSTNEEMFNKFDLQVEKLNENQLIYSKISYLLTVLADSTSIGLKGYGKLNEKSAILLDNYMNNLMKKLTQIEFLLINSKK